MNLAGATVDGLIDGDPDAVSAVAFAWREVGLASADLGVEIGRIDVSGWVGKAASRHQSRLIDLSAMLGDVTEAMAVAVGLAHEWSEALDEARAAAGEALDTYDHALDQRRYWLEHHETYLEVTGIELADVSIGTIWGAEHQVTTALRGLESRANAITPPLHGLADQVVDRFPWHSDLAHLLGEVGGGAADTVADAWRLFKKLNPIRLLVDFDGVRDDLADAANGAVEVGRMMVEDPGGFLDIVYDDVVNGFAANPARGVGEMAPDMVANVAAAGWVVAAGRRGTVEMARSIDGRPEIGNWATQRQARKWLEDLERQDPDRSHFVARHSPSVSRAKLRRRAFSGTLPNGSPGEPSAASRFYEWDIMREAIEVGQAHRSEFHENTFCIDLESFMGEGYLEGSDVLHTTTFVRFRFRSDGTLVTAYPELEIDFDKWRCKE